jgi:tetratricopeptide (TPR) repeat protein
MHYRYAMYFGRIGDHTQQRERLEEAVRQNPRDVDVLIAMHRLPNADPQWLAQTKQRIQAVAGGLLELAHRYEDIVDNPANQRIRMDILAPLASLHNQYAWLVSNTEGDRQEALRSSRRSLELSPDNPAYLDTLGRCYYALGDLDNAVKYQTRAVRLEPSTQQIGRQLKLFQKALAESQAEEADNRTER